MEAAIPVEHHGEYILDGTGHFHRRRQCLKDVPDPAAISSELTCEVEELPLHSMAMSMKTADDLNQLCRWQQVNLKIRWDSIVRAAAITELKTILSALGMINHLLEHRAIAHDEACAFGSRLPARPNRTSSPPSAPWPVARSHWAKSSEEVGVKFLLFPNKKNTIIVWMFTTRPPFASPVFTISHYPFTICHHCTLEKNAHHFSPLFHICFTMCSPLFDMFWPCVHHASNLFYMCSPMDPNILPLRRYFTPQKNHSIFLRSKYIPWEGISSPKP